MKLDKHKKIKNSKQSHHVSSVNISREQKLFLDVNGLNLSSLVREFLDDLIKKTKEEKNEET